MDAVSPKPGERGVLLSEDADLVIQHAAQAELCLGTLSAKGEPSAEQWAGMFFVLAYTTETARRSGVFQPG